VCFWVSVLWFEREEILVGWFVGGRRVVLLVQVGCVGRRVRVGRARDVRLAQFMNILPVEFVGFNTDYADTFVSHFHCPYVGALGIIKADIHTAKRCGSTALQLCRRMLCGKTTACSKS
jgi:hypothetical protein